MRWLIPWDQETEARTRTLEAIDAWWSTFERNSQEIRTLVERGPGQSLAKLLDGPLAAIDPALCWDIRGEAGDLLVSITPEAALHLRPMVDVLLARAPRLDGWRFGAYRLSKPVDTANQIAVELTRRPLPKFTAALSPGAHGTFDISFFGAFDEDSKEGVLVWLEHAIGEENLERWIGALHFKPKPFLGLGRAGKLPAELPSALEREIQSARQRLPRVPRFEIQVDSNAPVGAVIELEPQSADDFAGWDDLRVAGTTDQALWLATHLPDSRFSSLRFSLLGEQFCYLKLDGSEGLECTRFADRGEIEDALDEALRSAGLGNTWGGGTGLLYSYVDLVLTDVERAVPVIQQVLRDGRIGRRTWLQFFDVTLSQEWVGVYDDTPAPLLRTA